MTSPAIDYDREKRLAAIAAVAEVQQDMIVGLGTGSTVAFALDALAERCRSGLKIRTVATSLRTEALLRQSSMEILDFSKLSTVDLCIDGIDEIDGACHAIKGAGGAMLREKIVASAAMRMIAIADSRKAVDRLGSAPVPVETLPFALGYVTSRILQLGGRPVLRQTALHEPYRTDQGNAVLDCSFDRIDAPDVLAATISAIAGVLGHGLFVDEIDALYIARGTVVEKRERQAA
ncbi:ribose-5-phosphate isomerase RpiA [Sphingomonas paeninsulae]|uniref:Ribose-5-phosphate isomerase A n=1 Tax=Sphingomonas paeninsulae TaxID=2319844 RepID=A0A494TL39_SPHPE|nr:ribose-5-phosphate isomerase RpiA [Sphingomonas paeninsulae]AYJ85825.1 ribose-5-phosphate isomerase RpiA [Sphingomonas paeninsulae]